jgi:signal transduction histidine kinase
VDQQRHEAEARRRAESDESFRVIAAGLAHDYNNLLTGILGNASLATEMLTHAGDIATEPLLTEVITSTERAAALTRQLLTASGQGACSVEAIDVGSKLEEWSGAIQAGAPDRISLHFDVATGTHTAAVDWRTLRGTLFALVTNAVEAIGGADGTVSVGVRSREIDAPSRSGLGGYDPEPGRYVEIEVRDTGCGMDAPTLAHAFDPFFTTKFVGRGLGLAEARGGLGTQGGRIDAQSELKHGSTFRVLLRASPA